jgi:hypothetical protein
VKAALPASSGRSSVTQGRYGTRGNLELVACDPADGLWVTWFNSDPVEAAGAAAPRAGALPGHWSRGLPFARGRHYDRVHITQVRRGPDHLEVVARAMDGDVRRWVWTPADGFVDAGVIATATVATSAVVEGAAGMLHLLVVDVDGRMRHVQGRAATSTAATWTSNVVRTDEAVTDVALARDETLAGDADGTLLAAVHHGDRVVVGSPEDDRWTPAPGRWREVNVVPWRRAPHLVGISGRGHLQWALADTLTEFPDEPTWQHVSAAASTRDGGRIEIVATAGNRLSHGAWVPEVGQPPRLTSIAACVWA